MMAKIWNKLKRDIANRNFPKFSLWHLVLLIKQKNSVFHASSLGCLDSFPFIVDFCSSYFIHLQHEKIKKILQHSSQGWKVVILAARFFHMSISENIQPLQSSMKNLHVTLDASQFHIDLNSSLQNCRTISPVRSRSLSLPLSLWYLGLPLGRGHRWHWFPKLILKSLVKIG